MTDPPSPDDLARPGILIGELVQQFADRLAAAEQRGKGLESTVTGLVQMVTTLTGQVADLDERLSEVRRLLTEQRADLATERSLVFLGLGQDYTILVTQRFLNVAQHLADADHPKSALDTVQTVANLCSLLFGQVIPQPRDVLDALGLAPDHSGAQLVVQVVASATTLREKASGTPDRVMWDFSIEPGSPVNDRQAPWAHCDPDHPVRFVVAPAFLVNDLLIQPQLVYTSDQELELRPPALLGGQEGRGTKPPKAERKHKIPFLS